MDFGAYMHSAKSRTLKEKHILTEKGTASILPTSSLGEIGLESSKEDEFGGVKSELYFEES